MANSLTCCRSIGILYFYHCVILLVLLLYFYLRYFGSVQLNVQFAFTPYVNEFHSSVETNQTPIEETVLHIKDSFRDSWSRIHRARVDWRGILAPCQGITNWGSSKPGWEREFRSSGNNSYVRFTDIRSAGEFTRIFIHTRTKNGKDKTIGGDSWRVYLKGPSTVAATVFDHQNGTYEAMALILEPGEYIVEAILDYSLCDGLKDPPENWFRVGNAQGKFQESGILGSLDEYLVEPLQEGKRITIRIPQSDKILPKINELFGCEQTCNVLWDGYGRWIKNNWMPYIPEKFSETERQTPTFPKKRKDTLWFYGDSLALRFCRSLYFKPLCTKLFTSCRYSYNWVYPIPQENEKEAKTHNDDLDFRPNLVVESIRDVLRNKGMKTNDSLLVLNLGLHFVIGVNFTTYQSLIRDVTRMLEYREKELGSKARVVWKTSTAIHKEKIKKHERNATHWRFFTDQRVRLFDAFAMSAMCKAGIRILDVHHLTASSPKITTDVVHYEDKVFHKAEMQIQHFTTNSFQKIHQQICIR